MHISNHSAKLSGSKGSTNNMFLIIANYAIYMILGIFVIIFCDNVNMRLVYFLLLRCITYPFPIWYDWCIKSTFAFVVTQIETTIDSHNFVVLFRLPVIFDSLSIVLDELL
ncbi:hypothetical protein ACJX0J_021586 [Zea mays]